MCNSVTTSSPVRYNSIESIACVNMPTYRNVAYAPGVTTPCFSRRPTASQVSGAIEQGVTILALTAALQPFAAPDSFATPDEAPGEPDLWTRKTPTADWTGRRASLSNRGVVLDASTTGYYAGLLEGDGDKDFQWGGCCNALLHLNTGRINAFDLLAADPFFGGGARDRFAGRVGSYQPGRG